MKCPVPLQKLQVDPDAPAGCGTAFLGLPLPWSIADLNISPRFAIAAVRASIFMLFCQVAEVSERVQSVSRVCRSREVCCRLSC